MKNFAAVLLTLSFLIVGASAQAATIQDLQATIQTLRTTVNQLHYKQDIARVKLAACNTKTCIQNYQEIIETRHDRIVLIKNRITTIQTRIAKRESDEVANNQLTLAWKSPLPGEGVIGYYIYTGASQTDTSHLLADLTDFNINSPTYSVDTQRDLQVATAGRTCFRVKAYSNTKISKFSYAVCTS